MQVGQAHYGWHHFLGRWSWAVQASQLSMSWRVNHQVAFLHGFCSTLLAVSEFLGQR